MKKRSCSPAFTAGFVSKLPTYVITGDETMGHAAGSTSCARRRRPLASDLPLSNATSIAALVRACEQVCPAGVEYGQLLEAARGELFQADPSAALVMGVATGAEPRWLRPARLKLAFAAARFFRATRLPKRCGNPESRDWSPSDSHLRWHC